MSSMSFSAETADSPPSAEVEPTRNTLCETSHDKASKTQRGPDLLLQGQSMD
jgi:hypothetical protein